MLKIKFSTSVAVLPPLPATALKNFVNVKSSNEKWSSKIDCGLCWNVQQSNAHYYIVYYYTDIITTPYTLNNCKMLDWAFGGVPDQAETMIALVILQRWATWCLLSLDSIGPIKSARAHISKWQAVLHLKLKQRYAKYCSWPAAALHYSSHVGHWKWSSTECHAIGCWNNSLCIFQLYWSVNNTLYHFN